MAPTLCTIHTVLTLYVYMYIVCSVNLRAVALHCLLDLGREGGRIGGRDDGRGGGRGVGRTEGGR